MNFLHRQDSNIIPKSTIEQLEAYASKIPEMTGTYMPLPVIDDFESNRAPGIHDAMYRNELSAFALRGAGIESGPLLVQHADREIKFHIQREKEWNAEIENAATQLVEYYGDDLPEDDAESLERLLDGKADIVDKALLLSRYPRYFKAFETMNCRRSFDRVAMGKADAVAEQNRKMLRDAGFKYERIKTVGRRIDLPVGGEHLLDSSYIKYHSSRFISPNGVEIFEKNRLTAAQIDDGENFYLEPLLKSQFIYITPGGDTVSIADDPPLTR